MTVLSWRELDFAGVVLGGLIAGYLMTIAGLWAGRFPGLSAIDIADFGRRYMVSDRPSAWFFGLASHLANSVILAMVWAAVIEPNLAWPRPLSAIAFGIALSIVLAGLLVAPMAGLGFMGRKTGSTAFARTNLAMHVLWGAIVGFVYTGPR